MSLIDLYNNLKIVEQKVKKSGSTSTGSGNMAFLSSTSNSSPEYDNNIGTANPRLSTPSSQTSTASLSDETVYAFLASKPEDAHL